jgi:hypothetical protein
MNRKPHIHRRARDRRAAPVRRPPLDLATRLVSNAAHLISRLTLLGWLTGTALVLFSTTAHAAEVGAPMPMAADSIEAVVNNIRAESFSRQSSLAQWKAWEQPWQQSWRKGSPRVHWRASSPERPLRSTSALSWRCQRPEKCLRPVDRTGRGVPSR